MKHLIIENLPIWTSAPNSIKKLRGLILELAVRGLLVPQNPNDEPASELLKKIAEEKARLISEGKIKGQIPPNPPFSKGGAEQAFAWQPEATTAPSPQKQTSKTIPPFEKGGLGGISEAERPFTLPVGWIWLKLEDIGHDWGQTTPKSKFTYIDVGAINKEQGLIENPQIIDPENAPSRARKIIKKGTVIYSTVRPYLLNIAVVENDFFPEPIASTAFAIIHPYSGVLASFVYRYLRSPSFICYVESCQAGIAYPAINDKQFFSGLIPLPPLAEQHRIVAKVDELMQLCNQLEHKQNDNQQTHRQLVSTLLSTLTEATNPQAFQSAWSQIAANFACLFTTESSIEQLKQTILQLAVMGKLVPQDPRDEPASELLQKIATEKARLIAEGKIKKQNRLPNISEQEKPFALPNGWEWVRLPEIGELARGKSKHRPRNAYILYSDGNIPLVQTGDVSRSNGVIKTYTALYNETGLKQSRLWKKGTMCITIAANIADTGVLDFDACFPDSIVGFIPLYNDLHIRYFEYFLRTAKNRLEDFAPCTAQKNINLEILNSLLIPLPPSKELNRIVAKVDELMSLCDQLKIRLATTQTLQQQLAETLVQQALT